MNCKIMIHEISALGGGSPSQAEEARAVHLAECERCQLLLATSLVEWGRAHELPRPPRAIARWRPVALCLRSKEESSSFDSDPEDLAIPAGFQLDQDQDSFWEAAELERLNEISRLGWSIDAGQQGRIRRWLEELELLSRNAGGFFTYDDSFGSGEAVTYVRKRSRSDLGD
jgi:hypothetical protein